MPKVRMTLVINGYHFTEKQLETHLFNLEEQIKNLIIERDMYKATTKDKNTDWQEGYNAGLAKAKQALNEIL